MKYPTTHPLYLLDAKNELYPVYDVHEWARKFPEQYHLARDEIGTTGFAVETVFLGMAALYDEIGKVQIYALPFYFETVVYAANGRAVDADKYQEAARAKYGHKVKLEFWRKALGVDPSD
jgi:hypothetical protein